MTKRAVILALITAMLMLSVGGMAAQAAEMRMQSTAFGTYSLYLAVWNYTLPSVIDVIGKKPLLQLTVYNDSGKTLETVFSVRASYEGDGDWGHAYGEAEFTSIMIPAGKTEYRLNTDTLTRETLMKLIQDDNRNLQSEELLGDFASWEVNTGSYNGNVDEKRVVPRLVSLKFPPGRYELSITAKYKDPVTGIWKSLPADTHSFQIMDSISAVELVGPSPYDVVGAIPQFRWWAPKLPTHVSNVEVRLMLMHAGRVIWQPVVPRNAADMGNKEDGLTFNFDKTASETLVGGEEYSWYVELLDKAHTGPGGLVPGRIIDGTTSKTWTFKLPNTPPRATITARPDYMQEKSSYTFTAQYSDIEDAQLNRTPTRQWFVNGVAVGSKNMDTLTYQFNQAGVYSVEYRVTDSHGAATSDVAMVNVVKSEPPVLTLLSPKADSFEVGSRISLQAEVFDPDSNLVTLTFSVNGTNLYTQEFKGTKSVGPVRSNQVELPLITAGTYKIGVTAVDSEGLRAVQVVEVKAYRLAAPKVTISSPTAGRAFVLGDEVQLQANAVDEKGESYTVSWYVGSAKEPISGNVYRLVQERTVLRAVAQRQTAEGIKQGEARVELLAVPNQAPVVRITEVPAGLQVGQNVTLTAEVSDPEGDNVELHWAVTAPDGSHTDLGIGSVVSFNLQSAGLYKVVVTASDVSRAEQFRRQASAIVQVLAMQFVAKNQPPQVKINWPENQTRFTAGETINLVAEATDPDGDQIELIWRLGGSDVGTGVELAYQLGAVSDSYKLDADGYANISVQVIASDMKGGSAQAQINIFVKPLPQPHPIIGGINIDASGVIEGMVVGDSTVLIAGIGEEQSVTYRWLLGNEEVASGDQYTLTFTKAGRLALTLEAKNQFGLSGRSVVIFNVQANQPPELIIADVDPVEVEIGTQLALTAHVVDAENNYAPLEWMIDGQPIPNSWYVDEASHLSIWFSADVLGSYVITAKVKDNVGQVAGDTKMVVVRKPAPSVSDQPEKKQNELPVVHIEQPRAGGIENIIVGESIPLIAQVGDAEAGNVKVVWLLAGVPIAWSETHVAAGRKLASAETSMVFATAGRYTLIARAVDEDGGQAEAAVSVTVQPRAGAETTAAVIAKPLANAFIMTGTQVEFQADNVPVGASVSWISDIAGPLGADDSFSTTLSAGVHTITLWVNGSEVDNCQVTVVGHVELRKLKASVYEVGPDVAGIIRRTDGTTENIQPGQPFDLFESDKFYLSRGKVWVFPVSGKEYLGDSYPIGWRINDKKN